MKRIIIVILSVTVLASLGWLGWVGQRALDRNSVISTAFVALQVTGTAGVTTSDGKDSRLSTGDPVASSDTLVVGIGATVDLSAPNGDRIRISGPAQLKVKSLASTDKNTFLDLVIGSLKVYVAPLGDGQSFTVRTPSAVAGVRGTVFQVSSENLETLLSVAEGAVEIRNPRGDGETISVKKGFQIATNDKQFSAINKLGQIEMADMLFVKNIPDSVLPSQLDQMVHVAGQDILKLVEQLGVAGIWTMPHIDIPDFDLSGSDSEDEQSPTVQIAVDQGYIFKDLRLYKEMNGKLPDGLAQTMQTVTADPWGEPYLYQKLDDTRFNISSKGPDKREGSDDDIMYRRHTLD